METAPLDPLQHAMSGSGADASGYPKIVQAWVDENHDLVDGLTS